MENIEQLFFMEFDIPPIVKKGQMYLNTTGRFVELEAEEDMYPTINGDTILSLENVLLDEDKTSHIEIHKSTIKRGKNKGKSLYAYIQSTGEGDDYHHSFSDSEYNSRKDALLSLLVQYKHVKYIYSSVRKIFGQGDK